MLAARLSAVRLAHALAVLGVVVGSSVAVYAQPGEDERPRFGVALSGGGARGLAHIGVLKVLDEAGYAPDLVVGTSMGAVIGGLYASGWGSAALDSLAQVLDWGAAFSDAPDYATALLPHRLEASPSILTLPVDGGVALPRGFIDGQSISALLARLTWPVADVRDFAQLPVPFAAIATDFETGEPVRLTGAIPVAQAIRASLAVPAVFMPVEVRGRLLVDGGVVRNLPAEDARALGADVLLCVDVSDSPRPADSLRTLTDVLVQTTTLGLGPLTEAQRAYCDVLVRPNLGELEADAFDEASAFAARGREAMQRHLDELRSLLGDPGGNADARSPTASSLAATTTTRRIQAIEFEGLDPALESMARQRVGLPDTTATPLEVSADDVQQWVRLLHGTGTFEQVTYRVESSNIESEDIESNSEASGGAARVVLTVVPRKGGTLGLAVRFDSERRGAALIAFDLPGDALVPQSRLRIRARLGRDIRATAALGGPLGLSANAAWDLRTEYEEAPAFVLAGIADPLALRSETIRALARLMRYRFGRLGVGLAAGGEAYWITEVPPSAPDGASDDGVLALIRLLAAYESLDQPNFPRYGWSASAEAEQAAGSVRFGHYVLRARGFAPVIGGDAWQIVLHGGLVLGRTTTEAPPHRLFALGGLELNASRDRRLFDFAGYGAEALVGRAAQQASLGARLDLGSRHLGVRVEAGGAFDDWTWRADDYTWGWAITMAQETALGPVQVGLSGREWEALRVDATFGYTF